MCNVNAAFHRQIWSITNSIGPTFCPRGMNHPFSTEITPSPLIYSSSFLHQNGSKKYI